MRYEADQVRRFLSELISSEELVFDYFIDSKRVLIASLIDRISNPGNSACLEVLGVAPQAGSIESQYLRLIEDARTSLPKSKSAIEVVVPQASTLSAEFFLREDFELYYVSYTMEATQIPQDLKRGLGEDTFHFERLRTEYLSAYYDLLCRAFASNVETSVPSFDEMVAGFDEQKTTVRLLKINGRILGFLNVKALDNKRGEIRTLGLLPEARGKGLGKVLLAQALTILRDEGCDHFELTVAAANQSALTLYENFGFRVQRRETCYRWQRK
jgi:ribosomal protein S18 acetylase RimI-like enzyme